MIDVHMIFPPKNAPDSQGRDFLIVFSGPKSVLGAAKNPPQMEMVQATLISWEPKGTPPMPHQEIYGLIKGSLNIGFP